MSQTKPKSKWTDTTECNSTLPSLIEIGHEIGHVVWILLLSDIGQTWQKLKKKGDYQIIFWNASKYFKDQTKLIYILMAKF
jgi:hypothetical protein